MDDEVRMDEDEHDSVENRLCFYLHKFQKPLSLNKIKSVDYCLQAHVFVVHLLNKDLEIKNLNLNSQEKSNQETIHDVESYAVESNEDGPMVDHIVTLNVCIITKTFHLAVYATTKENLVLVSQTDLQSYCSDEKLMSLKITSAKLLKFKGQEIVVCINESHIIHMQCKDEQFISMATISIPECCHSFDTFQISDDLCITLTLQEENTLLEFYSIVDGKKLTEFNLAELQLVDTTVQKWQLSSDLRFLVIIYETGDFQYIDLASFCIDNPSSIKLVNKILQKRDTSLNTFLTSCQYGDYSWKEKLLHLHSQETSKVSQFCLKRALQSENSNSDKQFSKKKSAKVIGFHSKKSQNAGEQSALAVTSIIKAPDGLHGYNVDDVHIDPSLLSFVYTYNEVYILCQWNIKTQMWTKYRFKKGQRLLLSSNPSIPHLVVMATHLGCLVTDPAMGQEQFVSELMVYGGAALADAVCHINKWGRCSIPVHTLEVGLKHRQLDTVSYFLKSKENFFSSTKTVPVSPHSPRGSPSWTSQYSHYDNLVQLEPAVNLLLQTVTDSLGDKRSHVYAKQVLDISLDFLYGLLLDSLGVAETAEDTGEKKDLEKATETILSYIEEARSCVKLLEEKVPFSRTGSISAGSLSAHSMSNISVDVVNEVGGVDMTDGGMAHEWDKMDIETIIEDGIMKNKIPELQQYLLNSGEQSRADYSMLKSFGVTLAVNYIKHDNIKKAKELLMKLGLCVTESLWKVALHTLDRTLCNSIIKELLSSSVLTQHQVSMVTFLQQINELYPCRDFEGLKSLHHHVKDSETHQDNRLKNIINPSPVYDLTEECGNLSEPDTVRKCRTELQETTHYNEVLLSWVENWNERTKQMIKLEVLLHKPGSDISVFDKEVIWDYLLSHNMCDVIVAWIHNSFHGNKSDSTQNQELKWPVSHLGKIPAEYVDHIEFCTSFVRDNILNAFASHGVFSQETLSSFTSLVTQLNTLGGALQLPHPLQHCVYTSVDQFHLDMIQYCVNHNLSHFLWNYCRLHRLLPQLVDYADESSTLKSSLRLFNQFFAITTERNDIRSAMYQSSLTNAVTVWGKQTSCVGELLQSGHTLAALATLMFSSHQLQQVTFVTQQLEAFDGLSSETVERAIQMYPKLHMTLFPASTSDAPNVDVSMYQLLVGNAPFDPRKLFGWQTTNVGVSEDAMMEMPYFSNSNLVAKYAYSEQLRYTYYLKQGRPSFAFITFLAEEFKNGSPTIPSKRLMTAIGTSLWVGVKHFNQSQIASSCVLFQELLGHDSLLLRTYIQVGNEILTHCNNAVTGTMDKRREQIKKNEEEIVELLLDCVQAGRQYSPTVLQALEAAILASVTRDRLQVSRFECGHRWTIAVIFCHLMRLPFTTVFLESCAQTNQWLPFIWFSQIHQYPKEQLLNLLHMFKSVHLQEHLRYVLANADIRSVQGDQQKKSSTRKRIEIAKDVRSSFFSKIGVLKEKESDVSSTSEDEDAPTILSGLHEADRVEDDDIQVTFDSSPGDVFGVVFVAQASRCPWKTLLTYSTTLRNPLFAELAACLQGAVVLPCLCGWLVAMMDVTEHTQFLEHHGRSPWRYNMHTLDAILDVFVKQKWGSLLVTGFDIFQQDSPLLPFLQFYAEFTERKNYKNCRLLLDLFKEAVFQFNHEKSKQAANVIGDSQWLEQTTYRILQYMMTCTPSVYEVSQLLKILDTESITLIFTQEDPDFRKQSKLMQCLQAGDIRHVNFPALLSPNNSQYETECLSIIDQLINKQMYDEARKFGKVAGQSTDHVTIAQMKQQKHNVSTTEIWSSKHARLKFYRDCAESFKKYEVSSAEIAEFFKIEAGLTESLGERASLYELCLQCITGAKVAHDDHTFFSELYRNMWLNRIQEKVENKEAVESLTADEDMFSDLETRYQGAASSAGKKELICVGKLPHKGDQPENLTEKEVKALQELLGDLLKQGQITECCRVSTEFKIYCQDLAILLTCIRLSLGSMLLEHFDADMLHLLRTQPGDVHRQSIAAPVALLRNSSTISLLSNIQPTIDTVSDENEEKISAMERLLNHCNEGKHTCIRVLTAFKISAVLGIGYDDVVTGDDYHILRSLLKTNCMAKFRLASDFLGTSSLSPEEVAGFLSDAILQSYRVSLGETTRNQELFFDPGENFSDFHQIVRLCKEPSLLGDRLLDSVASMSESLEQSGGIVLTLQTEVLILAHECYTAACDMEGISNILRAARILTSHLETATEFQLMTRLLTGVGRYNEMTYIFDALQQNHQFELLLGKGMEKETKLKTAILDYLKRYHPMDSDTYTMVALKFMMYREIAQLLEDNANKLLNKFKGKPLDNTTDTQSSLQKVAQFLSEAAESYIKDSCLRHAQVCIRKARLVALQVKHLPSNQQFINLTTKGANLLIADHPQFTEAYIISEAYNQKESWALALCNNVINRGDMKYLQEFRTHIRITPQLIEDAVDRYQQCTDKSAQAPGNIKKLLQFCKDVKVQYRIAKQLGLREVINSLEKGDSKSYIMDFAYSVS